jgi:hypothetical protein
MCGAAVVFKNRWFVPAWGLQDVVDVYNSLDEEDLLQWFSLSWFVSLAEPGAAVGCFYGMLKSFCLSTFSNTQFS